MNIVARIRVREVARLTSLSESKVYEMAAAGRIPGAAKLGGTWTFDPDKIEAWIRRAERLACPAVDQITIAERASMAGLAVPAKHIDEAFERLIRKKSRTAGPPHANHHRVQRHERHEA